MTPEEKLVCNINVYTTHVETIPANQPGNVTALLISALITETVRGMVFKIGNMNQEEQLQIFKTALKNSMDNPLNPFSLAFLEATSEESILFLSDPVGYA